MNFRSVFHLIAYVVIFMSVAIAAAALVGLGCGDAGVDIRNMFASAGIVLALGVLMLVPTRGKVDLTRKDGFAIVTFGWLVIGLVGAIPYLMTGAIPSPVDAVFETLSGFTTTGSTVVTDIEILPRSIVFWRSLTQWLGGMGVVLLCVAILPFLGVGGMQIYRAEMPGPSKDRLTPRIANTAKLLYGVYVLLTGLQILALRIAGMNLFDAVNHSFCTLSSGGFSPYNASIAHFPSPAIHLILAFFMIVAGANFTLHYRFLRGDGLAYFRSSEMRAYLLVVLGCTGIIAWNLCSQRGLALGQSLVDSLFQVSTIITTTGFATADYDQWPLLSKTILFALLFSGACAGSTSGGLKIVRVVVVVKECLRQLKLFMQPHAVLKVRMGPQTVPATVVSAILGFFLFYLLLFLLCTLIMTLFLPDLTSAASAVIACISNVGPGFNLVGPTRNFAAIADGGKILLTFCMLLGRLELFTVLVLFSPRFWRK